MIVKHAYSLLVLVLLLPIGVVPLLRFLLLSNICCISDNYKHLQLFAA